MKVILSHFCNILLLILATSVNLGRDNIMAEGKNLGSHLEGWLPPGSIPFQKKKEKNKTEKLCIVLCAKDGRLAKRREL